MTESPKFHSDKWRPTLGMIVTAMLIFILMLPLGSIWFFRFYDSQLVRDTENELISQGAFVKAMLQSELERADFDPQELSVIMPPTQQPANSIRWIEPQLDLTASPILPSRAEALTAETQQFPAFLEAGKKLTEIITEAQKTTLAGFRILDPNGVVIAGGNEVGLSLAHVDEVQTALAGTYSSVIRERTNKSGRPPIYSISRGTDIRVFVAMPVDYEGRVAGVVYISRTPSHFLRELYSQRWKLAGAFVFLIFVTLAIAALFVRTIKGPIDALNDRTKRISRGDRTAISPLPRHGTKEIADLAQGLLSMSRELQGRADYIRNFANHVSHELKSPITSIRGAAELMADASERMNEPERQKFLENILGDTERMTALLERLRELAAVENSAVRGSSRLSDEITKLASEVSGCSIKTKGDAKQDVAISSENIQIILTNMVGNAIQNDATELIVSCVRLAEFVVIDLQDNGTGISEANREKVFDLFFTTSRDSGGTGMGLNIVQSILDSQGGSIEIRESATGACFRLKIPLLLKGD